MNTYRSSILPAHRCLPDILSAPAADFVLSRFMALLSSLTEIL